MTAGNVTASHDSTAEMTSLRFNAWMTHERLDDEVIAINLETGAYYALDGAAADAWTLVAAGASTDEIVAILDGRYDTSADTLRADVVAFLAELTEQGIATDSTEPAESAEPALPAESAESAESAAPTPGDAVALVADGGTRRYTPPSLNRYDDLADLLLLDPIHEVDDAGWPIARTE
jgi:hypothetical protein